jgi:hypothetical protein
MSKDTIGTYLGTVLRTGTAWDSFMKGVRKILVQGRKRPCLSKKKQEYGLKLLSGGTKLGMLSQ